MCVTITRAGALRAAAAFLGLVALGVVASRHADGPLGMLPGGPFRDEAAACPTSGWERYALEREVALEVRPSAPRSVTVWSVVWRDALYVPADFLTPFKRWPQQVVADGRVRLRIGTAVFACNARRVDDVRIIEALRRGIAAKYGLAPDGAAARAEVWWFRIDPRGV